MSTDTPRHSRYDAVVVGARCAGAATALLLAREGLRVLVVDDPDTDLGHESARSDQAVELGWRHRPAAPTRRGRRAGCRPGSAGSRAAPRGRPIPDP